MTKRMFVLMTAALLLTILNGCSMLGKKSEPIASHDDLKKEYKSSKDNFRAKYNGKEVAVWGKVNTLNPTAENVYLRLDTTDADLSGVPDVMCAIDKPDISRFNDLKVEKGTSVRVKGTMSIDEKDLYPIQLKTCKLVTIGIANVMSDQ